MVRKLNFKWFIFVFSMCLISKAFTEDQHMKIGDIITFGEYKMRVLHLNGNRALVITENILFKMRFNPEERGNAWSNSEIRDFLNNEFLNTFSNEEQNRITQINNKVGEPATNDKIFLLTEKEAELYFNNDSERIAFSGSVASSWFLRSSFPSYPNRVCGISSYGDAIFFGGIVVTTESGVRPAMWIKSSINEVIKETILNNISQKLKIGDIITFGKYQWRVLDLERDKALIITEDIIFTRWYNSEGGGNSWIHSEIRAYLNKEFYFSFSNDDKSRITVSENIVASPASSGQIFLLAIREAELYFDKESDRIAKLDGSPTWWWLRSPHRYRTQVVFVNSEGKIELDGEDMFNNGGIRPAMWIKLFD
jgi:co-chaperonin GroES (HSP10)